MEHTSAFDLNGALHQWLDALAESSQFRAADWAELESHIRDSVNQLQIQGLSAEESFIIATKRVGTVEKMGPEFAKVHRNPKLIFIHLLILVFFSVGCWFLWALLKVATLAAHAGRSLPAFTVMMCQHRTMLMLPPVLAAVYCMSYVFRRTSTRASWIGFFACTAGILLLLIFPVVAAVVLPLIDAASQMWRPQ